MTQARIQVKARGWPVAVLAKYAKVPLEWDSATANTWPATKDKAPFGQLPVLEDNGRSYAQSGALYRIIARRGGLEGGNDHEFALNQMLVEEYQVAFLVMSTSD
jgi:glutathione S-transferase